MDRTATRGGDLINLNTKTPAPGTIPPEEPTSNLGDLMLNHGGVVRYLLPNGATDDAERAFWKTYLWARNHNPAEYVAMEWSPPDGSAAFTVGRRSEMQRASSMIYSTLLSAGRYS